jgi:hypothetical protein
VKLNDTAHQTRAKQVLWSIKISFKKSRSEKLKTQQDLPKCGVSLGKASIRRRSVVKLWPFSKKASDEFVLDRTMNLPAGVVLATPDDPALSELPLPSVPTPQNTADSPNNPATTLPMDQQAPALPKTNDPPLSPEIQQILGLAPPPSPPQPPTSDLPDLPSALFDESAVWTDSALETLTTAADPPADMSINPTTDLSDTSGFWTPSEPELSDMAAISYSESATLDMPSLIPDPTTSEPILSELFQNSAALPDQPTQIENPPSQSMSAMESPIDACPESIILPASDSFSHTIPDPFDMPMDAFANTFSEDAVDPLIPDPAYQSIDTPPIDLTMEETLALLPPDPEPHPTHHCSPSDTEQAQPDSSSALADLLAEAEAFQPDDRWDDFAQPGTYESSESSITYSDEFASLTEPAPLSAEPSFFANATFDDMDNFGQPDANHSFFTESSSDEPMTNDTLAIEDDFSANALQDDSMAETEWDTSTYDGTTLSDMDNMSSDEDYTPEFTLSDSDEQADENTAFNHVSFEDEPETGNDITSYDLGHYDDPDEPTVAFVLEDTTLESPEPYTKVEPDLPTEDSNREVDFSTERSAQFYWGLEMPEECVASTQVEETPPSPIEESVIPPSIPQPTISATTDIPKPTIPETPAILSTPASPVSQQPPPTEPIPRALPPKHKYYGDSVTEALDSFEQEMLMRDSHFITQSINNLVERYFAQKKAENEW